jgi:hypothetical protein
MVRCDGGSVSSLNSNGSSQLTSQQLDSPEQFENLKQQKEIMEHDYYDHNHLL